MFKNIIRIKKDSKFDDLIFFVHIPKTAGTSFRIGAESYFGKKKILQDYGNDSHETSKAVQSYIYTDEDYYGFKRHAQKHGKRFLTGHVLAKKYNPICRADQIATFLRHPLEQVVSHYEHYVRLHEYQGSLEEFVRDKRFTNVQHRQLNNIPLELIGFLGLTERYADSIEVFNHYYSVKFRELSLNRKKQSNTKKPEFSSRNDIDETLVTEILQLNSLDFQLYQHAEKLFDERYRMLKQGNCYVQGFVNDITDGRINGVAYAKNSDQAVTLELYVNDAYVGECRATESRPHLRHYLVPRNAFVGFSMPLLVAETDKVVCRVKGTGQEIFQRLHLPAVK